jgi:hypothetical protein
MFAGVLGYLDAAEQLVQAAVAQTSPTPPAPGAAHVPL